MYERFWKVYVVIPLWRGGTMIVACWPCRGGVYGLYVKEGAGCYERGGRRRVAQFH